MALPRLRSLQNRTPLGGSLVWLTNTCSRDDGTGSHRGAP